MAQKLYTRISQGEADKLILQHNGRLVEWLSFEPQKIYELDDSSAIVIFSFEKKAYLYSNKNDVIIDPDRNDVWLQSQDFFKNFGKERDKLLSYLDSVINFSKLDASNEQDMLKVESFLNRKIKKDNNKIASFQMGIFIIGELLCRKYQLTWAFKETLHRRKGIQIISPFLVALKKERFVDYGFSSYFMKFLLKDIKKLYIEVALSGTLLDWQKADGKNSMWDVIIP